MTGTLTLWGHALAALLFVTAALATRARRPASLPPRALLAALGLTAMWALAVAGIDARDLATRLVAALRDVAWLVVLLVVARRDGHRHAARAAQAALPLVAIGLALLTAAMAVIAANLPAVVALRDTGLALHALQLLAGLVLVNSLTADTREPAARLLGIALGLLWGADLVIVGVVAMGWGAALVSLSAARGAAVAGAALLVAAAAARPDHAALAVSRAATGRLLSTLALAAFAGLTALLTAAAQVLGGSHARLAQTAIVFGATAALLTLLSTPWLRGWGKVMVAKHLFTHRYDYRAEWQRFSETLARAGAEAPPLGERVARAMAELTVSPAALLLCREGEALSVGAGWRWDTAPTLADTAALVRHLNTTRRIVEIDAVRAGRAAEEEGQGMPAVLIAEEEAWIIVPLVHLGDLIGAVVLARPPVDRALDWEDLDLLRVAGRQAAGVLAEDRARIALADAERFDEFNRRFAFILHDIKNLVSQQTLLARNAERHADNPAFRADMIATLRDSSERMHTLLARLSAHTTAHEPVRALEAARLVGRLARRHSAVTGDTADDLWLLADPAALETVLDHLVHNALDASRADEAIVIRVREQSGAVAITVADRGCGMDAAFVRDRLFRPFVSTKPGGFGLGAFEARQMVEAMGGRLEVDSRLGEGTCMTVILPRAQAPAAASLQEAA